MQLADNVYAITGMMHPLGVNSGFVITKNQVIAIDSSWYDVSAKFIIRYIKALTKNLITHLILTEHHSDHIFGMRYFKDEGAQIIAHKNTKEFLRKHKDYAKKIISKYREGKILFKNIKLCKIDQTIDKDTVLDIDNEKIVLLETPGHTNSNICVYIPKSKVLFAGDLIYSEFKPTTKFGNPELWKSWIKSLEKIEKLDINYLVPGHGRILKRDKIQKEIKRHKKYLMGKIKNLNRKK